MSEFLVGPMLPDLRTLTLDAVLRLRMKRAARAGEVTDERLRKQARIYSATMLRARREQPWVTVQPCRVGDCGAEWVSLQGARPEKVVLYFHGGGFHFSSPAEHRILVWRLARALSRRVLAVEYRKAPDHAFPAWIDDAVASYRGLLEQGFEPRDIILSGDSAGGNIALAATHRIREEQLPMPEALVLFSPWADLTCSGESYRINARRDAMFDPEAVRGLGRYLTRYCDPYHPEVSPAFADYDGFPPTIVLAGATEVFLDDARAVVRRAKVSGVDATLYVHRHMPHVFPMFAGLVPRAAEGFNQVQRFLEKAAG